MKLLILGGTVFLGRALVAAARQRGHTITLFNRGRSNPGLFPDIETVEGDRDGDLSKLAGRRFDAVIDTSGYVPRVVRQSATQLAPLVDHYSFISSISVYGDLSRLPINEGSPVATLDDPTVEEVNGETYGALKALCETEVERALGDRALVVRPGLIVGPYDPSDRFTYWPCRFARGGDVLVPGRPGRRVRFTDVRDLAEWNVRMAEEGVAGVFNADGPQAEQSTMEDLVRVCEKATSTDSRPVWIDDPFLVEREVGAWMELPLWIPEADPEHRGFFEVEATRAEAHGLSYRPILDTVHDTLEWALTRAEDHTWRAGLAREREEELLSEWRATSGASA